MKHGQDMYHLKTSHLHNKEGGSDWAVGGRIEKIKKCHQINKMPTLTSNQNSLKNAMNVGFFTVILNHLALLLKGDTGGKGGANPPYEGCSFLNKPLFIPTSPILEKIFHLTNTAQ